MLFHNNSVWEVSAYILLLVLLFTLVRFIATSITNLLKGFPEDQEIVVDPYINGVQYAVSYWTERGGRPYQEDRHDMIKGIGQDDSSLYAVFDGHGGMKAAQFCKENLLRHVVNDSNFIGEPCKALERAFFRTDAEFSATAKIKALTDGTTAIVAVTHGKKIYVANAGDSRCIMIQKGGRCRHMSVDHKPNREDEEKRIRQLGGKVVHWGRWRVQGVLAVSRAIGDVALQPYVTCEPEIQEKDIGPEDEYLVLASDGVWDVLRNDDVAKLVWSVASKDFVNVAKMLCSEALIMGSTDNVTAVVVDLKNRIASQSGRVSPTPSNGATSHALN
jgi:protein phosphatase 1L